MRGKVLQLMVLVLMVSGCTQMKPLSPSQRSLLEEYGVVRSWSATQTESAVKGREQFYAQTPSEMSRLSLALALGFGKGAATDPKRALQLFDETAKGTATQRSSEALFAEVFAGFLKERIQSEAKISAAEAKINSLSKQTEKEHERADELEKKLEALKSIEKSLRKR
jgi:uncharacterized caspase-like protein